MWRRLFEERCRAKARVAAQHGSNGNGSRQKFRGFCDGCLVLALALLGSGTNRMESSTTDSVLVSPRIIGEFVRNRRVASNLTQKELGELAGVGTRLISELERGKATLRLDAVNKVLRVVGKMLGCVDAPRDEVEQ